MVCYFSINSLAILMNERIVNELPTIKGFQKMLHSFKMSSAVPIKKYFILFLNRHNAYCSVKCKKKIQKKTILFIIIFFE